ncbi:MAG: fasciclin domain-containing protein [Bradymonadia bacterium]
MSSRVVHTSFIVTSVLLAWGCTPQKEARWGAGALPVLSAERGPWDQPGDRVADLNETLAERAELSIWNDLVKRTEIDEILDNNGPYTVLAPTNDAFKALPTEVLVRLRDEPQWAYQVVARHVVLGTVPKGSSKSMETLAETTLPAPQVRRMSDITITAQNGTLNPVRTLLLP